MIQIENEKTQKVFLSDSKSRLLSDASETQDGLPKLDFGLPESSPKPTPDAWYRTGSTTVVCEINAHRNPMNL